MIFLRFIQLILCVFYIEIGLKRDRAIEQRKVWSREG
jgi:hypothetical protein